MPLVNLLIKITKKLYQYGAILVLFFYICILIFLDKNGFFLKKTKLISNYFNKDLELTCNVLDEPDIKSNSIEFPVEIFFQLEKDTGFFCGNSEVRGIIKKSNRIKLLAKYYYEYNNDIEPFVVLKVRGKILKLSELQNPGLFSYGKYLLRQGFAGTLNIYDYKIISKNKIPLVYKITTYFRKQIIKIIEKNLSYQYSSIIKKMFIGEKGTLSEHIKNIFIDAGVMHVLVVSGLNIGYIIGIFYFLFKFLPISNKYRNLLLIIPIILYTLITGADPPIVRACIMSIVFILSFCLSREVSIYHTLSLACLIILLIDPQSLFGASLQLSFAACFGLIFIYPKLNRLLKNLKLNKILKFLIDIFFASLSCQIMTAPIIAYYFNKVSVVSLISNIVIVPLAGILLYLCFVMVFTSYILPQILFVINKAITITVNIFIVLTEFFAKTPFSTFRIFSPDIFFMISYYLLVFFIFKFLFNKKKNVIISSVLIIFFIFINFSITKIQNKKLEIVFLKVGLGDCIFIKTPDNKVIFIDMGGSYSNVGKTVIQPFLMSKGIMNIDKIIITNLKWTHCSGLKYIYKNFNIKEILTYRNLSKFQTVKLNNVYLKILNKEPVVIKLTYKKFKILFTSDCLNYRIVNNVNVIQIPSHGKNNILNINKISDKNIKFVISTDKPNSLLMKKFLRYEVFTTVNSAVIILSDGEKFRIYNY